LGEETVAGVDRVTLCLARGLDDGLLVEISADGIRARGERASFGRYPRMERERVGGGVDGNRFDAERGRGASDAHGDLAAVGDEDSFDHVDVPGAFFQGWNRQGRLSSLAGGRKAECGRFQTQGARRGRGRRGGETTETKSALPRLRRGPTAST